MALSKSEWPEAEWLRLASAAVATEAEWLKSEPLSLSGQTLGGFEPQALELMNNWPENPSRGPVPLFINCHLFTGSRMEYYGLDHGWEPPRFAAVVQSIVLHTRSRDPCRISTWMRVARPYGIDGAHAR